MGIKKKISWKDKRRNEILDIVIQVIAETKTLTEGVDEIMASEQLEIKKAVNETYIKDCPENFTCDKCYIDKDEILKPRGIESKE